MRKNQVLVGAMLLVVAVLAVGCAKPPQQEIDGAKAALTAAEQAEAPKYAADAWDKAQQAMNAVNAELEAQNAKFALFRSYTKAKQLIAEAQNAANAAWTSNEIAQPQRRQRTIERRIRGREVMLTL